MTDSFHSAVADSERVQIRDDGGPAFPWGEHGAHLGGMSLRDYFAIRATEQDIENHRAYNIDPKSGHPVYTMTVEQGKYAYADAMLKARSV